ncbi:MAG: AraC family transcriptional regulator [Clostridia bacterium]|nr:AraC family transcriptional regulator [Clostridia bacterium]
MNFTTCAQASMKTSKTEFLYPDSATDIHMYYKNTCTLHSHDYYEIFLLTDGEAYHRWNDRTDILKKQTVGLIIPGAIHQFSNYKNHKLEQINLSIVAKEFTRICDTIDETLINKINRSAEPIYLRLDDKTFEYILHLTNRINILSSKRFKTESAKLIKLILLNIVINFKQLSSLQTDTPEWLQDYLKTLSLPEYFTQPLSELYHFAPYSQSLLNKYFKQYLGQTMVSYVTKQKINYARNLLQNTDFSILYISDMLSYKSLAHFNRTFKSIVGTTPSLYRKQSTTLSSDASNKPKGK